MSNKRDHILLATRDLVFEQGLQGSGVEVRVRDWYAK